MPALSRDSILAALLVLLGVGHMAAELGDWPLLGRAARSVAASPAPGGSPRIEVTRPPLTVSRVFVQWRQHGGGFDAVELDAERLARLAGPAPRRALYRLALARGPELAADPARAGLLDALLEHALCGERPLLVELGIDTAEVAGEVSLQYQRGEAGIDDGDPVVIEARCR